MLSIARNFKERVDIGGVGVSPSSVAARMMRMAISDRLATSSFFAFNNGTSFFAAGFGIKSRAL